ncbi:MAG: cation:proton antiporter [Proteobacteria bacterium]|nr:cation:proton antiporter [Pseudomonadota bacterium]
MDIGVLMGLASLILLFGLVSKRLQTSAFTPPMAFVAFGLLVGSGGLDWVRVDAGTGAVHAFAELTLILVLFLDASRIDLAALRRQVGLSARLLGVGMPLTLALGTVLGVALFSDLSLAEAALLAAILTPTDAALGQTVISNPVVPARIRQSLNVESGLNDGLALPAVLVLAALAEAQAETDVTPWVTYTALQIGLGPLVGAAVGYAGGKLVERASDTGWMNHAFQELSGLALALLAFAIAEEIGGNGFLSAFAAGLTLGNTSRSVCRCLYDFTEVEGQLLVLVTFSLFGALLVFPSAPHWNWTVALYAVLSLTVVRMVPVAISLFGTRLRPVSVLFLGWFGPRGLASILFGLLIVERLEIPHHDEIFATVILTVLASVFLHGASAAPAARAYGRRVAPLPEAEPMPEHEPAAEMPLRVSPPSNP